ncbi:MAG: M24 family metallopeptidase [Candidatus Hydrothermarchaeales archaeon]
MRIERALDLLSKEDIDSAIILKPENIYYLSGFYPTTASALILKPDPLLLISKMDAKAIENCPVETKIYEKFQEEFKNLKGKIGVEKKYTTMHFHEEYLKGRECKNVDFIERMRQVKDGKEVLKIQRAIKIAERAIKEVSNELCDKSEIEIAQKAEAVIRSEAKIAFDTIVASGRNSSVPHHESSKKKIRPKDSVIIDIGANWRHYNSDITRTFCQSPSEEYLDRYDIVKEAQKEGIKEMKVGGKISNVDNAVRRVISEYGLEEHFIHSSGHGIGLEVHEAPRIVKDCDDTFKEGMVVTIEPGVYKGFGIRIEDMVLIKKSPKILTKI